MGVDLDKQLVLLHPAEDMLHDDSLSGLETIEGPLSPSEDAMIPKSFDRGAERIAGVVSQRPVITSIQRVVRHRWWTRRGALALKERVVVDAPR